LDVEGRPDQVLQEGGLCFGEGVPQAVFQLLTGDALFSQFLCVLEVFFDVRK